MNWSNRLRDASYRSPGGAELTFTYEDVAEVFDAKTTAFEFADADGTYVQDLGRTGRRYPLRVILWGADCDLEAEAWMNALQERGVGTLSHPRYGTVSVVPMGTVKRSDSLVEAANQVIIDIEFFETTGLVYPAQESADDGEISEKQAAADEAQASQLVEAQEGATAVDKADFGARYKQALDTTADSIRTVADVVNGAQRQFDNIKKSIDRSLNVLIDQPASLAFQTIQLLKAPARAAEGYRARFDAYSGLFDQITGQNRSAPGYEDDSSSVTSKTELSNNDLYASGIMSALVLATTEAEFENRVEAVEAADLLATTVEKLADWRDNNYRDNDVIDTGGSWQATQELVAAAAGALVSKSFDLPFESRITLTRDRTIVDLAYELYGEVDENLDRLINDNNLSGDAVQLLSRGQEIIYYAEKL